MRPDEPTPQEPVDPTRRESEHGGPLSSTLYQELRRLAARSMRRERAGHTLQPTALVHEAYLRLSGQDVLPDLEGTRFRAVAAEMVRRILIDHARGRGREKRGGDARRVTLDGAALAGDRECVDLLALHEALERLAALDPRQARVVQLRFFGGLGLEEIAGELGVSARTVSTDWRMARAWLARELEGEGGS